MDIFSQIAQQLDTCTQTRKATRCITLQYPNLTLQEAYQIRDVAIRLREQRGEKIVGYKMGLTSRVKQEQMHVSTPIFGVLTNVMQVQNKQSISLRQFIQPKVEPEIAFILGKDLHGSESEAEVMAACSGICAALDIIDSRYIDFKFTLIDVVADNTSSGGFVLGPIHSLAGIDLANLNMNLLVDNVVVDSGNSKSILGNPINSLMMLSQMLAEQNSFLKAGSIVLSGAATRARTLHSGLQVSNMTETLGEVSVVVAY